MLGHTDTLYGIADAPDGARLATASGEATVKIWDAATGNLHTLRGSPDEVRGVAYSSDGRFLATVSDTTVRLWGLR